MKKNLHSYLIFLLIAFAVTSVQPLYSRPSSEFSGFLTPEEIESIDEALANLKMDQDDLKFKRDYIDDEYRIELCQMVLEDPMLVPDYADLMYRFINMHGERLETVMVKGYMDIDYLNEDILQNLEALTYDETVELTVNEDIHPFNKEIINEYYKSMKVIQSKLEKAFQPLDNEDQAFINTQLLEILLEDIDEDDEDDISSQEFYARATQLLEMWKSLNLDELGKASVHYGQIMDEMVREYWLPVAIDPETYKTHFEQMIEIESPLGLIILGTFERDIYTKRAFLIIDPGGDDFYTFDKLKGDANVRTIVDCGGNDYYLSQGDFAFGSGYFGIGGLFDLGGDDIYVSQSFSLGSGLFGTGILMDYMGHDLYKSDSYSQGSGAFGLGYLHDAEGDDHYTGAFQVQGFAFTGGMGLLSDKRGDDSYWAGGKYPDDPRYPDRYLSLSQGFSIGIRPIASGGVGILFDYEGSDNYWTDIYGQGVSYWFSLGILVDGDGHDWYESHQYNQGSGIHLSTGILIDHAGNDRYVGGGLSQGNAHDYAVGWLIDREGNDSYTSTGLSLGGSNTNSVAIFIDDAGNDVYYCGAMGNSLGWGGEFREFGGIGIFLDLAGRDYYSDNRYKDGDSWVRDNWGAGIDREIPTED